MTLWGIARNPHVPLYTLRFFLPARLVPGEFISIKRGILRYKQRSCIGLAVDHAVKTVYDVVSLVTAETPRQKEGSYAIFLKFLRD